MGRVIRVVSRRLTLRLALFFFSIVLAAVAVIYFYVVPQLESRLREQKLDNLATAAQRYSGPIVRAIDAALPVRRLDQRVSEAGDRANARVTLLGVPANPELSPPYVITDSTTRVPIADLQLQVADEALATGRPATGAESTNDGRIGQAARPLRHDRKITHVVVFSAPLSDVQSNVTLIRRQILIAGGIALALALLAGYLAARAVSRRVKRLEQAAEKVAAGDFSHPIPVDSEDELGQLAVAFNQMQRQLGQLDSARKRFIAIASHELRTPLFSLGGFVELLEDEDLDEETRAQFLKEIRDQIDRLTNLATELLDLSRLESGSLELHPGPVDVGGLAREVGGEFGPALAQHRSDLRVRVPEEEIVARCDRDRTAQVIRILIDNAVVHTPEGTDISVSAERRDGRARIVVRDSGPGIPRASLPHVFEPFYTGGDGRGAGLGLAIARELADQMQGRLTVSSRSGSTAFTLELPGAPPQRGPAGRRATPVGHAAS